MTSIKHSREVLGDEGKKIAIAIKGSLAKQPGGIISRIGGWDKAKLKALWWRQMTSE